MICNLLVVRADFEFDFVGGREEWWWVEAWLVIGKIGGGRLSKNFKSLRLLKSYTIWAQIGVSQIGFYLQLFSKFLYEFFDLY